MDAFWLTLALTAVVGVIIAWVDSRFTHPAARLSEATRTYPQRSLLRFASFCAIAVWAAILVFFVCFLAMWVGSKVFAAFLLPAFAILLGAALAYLLSAIPIKCIGCGKRLLAQTTSKPAHSEQVLGMQGWVVIVLRVAALKQFKCMFCGQSYVP